MSKILVDSEEYFKLKNKINELVETNKKIKEKYVYLEKRVGCYEDINKLTNTVIVLKAEQEQFNQKIKNVEQENKDLKDAKLELEKYKNSIKKQLQFAEQELENKKNNIFLKIALCAIAKNENLYIRDWVEYYKNIGISKIFIYDNNEKDGERFEEVIDDYINSGFVEIIDVRGEEKGCVFDNDGINLQPACYIDCYENKCKDFDWIAMFDVDEFIHFKNGYNIFTFLNQDMFDDIDTILISWEHFSDNNLIHYENIPVTKRFTAISKYNRHGVKSIVRTNKQILNKLQPNLIHIFRLENNNTMYSSGIKMNDTQTWYLIPDDIHNSAVCVLNHYKTKTAEEYIQRHLGRHWGTGKKTSSHALDINDLYSTFFNFNDETSEKLEIFKKHGYIPHEEIKQEIIEKGNKKGLKLNVDNPVTIQDKINWLKIYDVTPLKSLCADKIKLHEYCIKKLNKDICIPILKIYENAEDINLNDLPQSFVLKCNHGYNMNIIVKNKDELDIEYTKNKLQTWKNTKFGKDSGQLHYSYISPKIYAEQYMNDGHDTLIDYKFNCFNGVPTHCKIIQNRKQLNYYDMNFNFINISQLGFPSNPNKLDKKPKKFELMKEYAKILSEDFKFVRVDFYEINNEVYLGELTFTPGNGFFKYKNPDDSIKIGNLLIL